MVDPNLGQIARIVQSFDLLADESSESRLDVAAAHQPDAIAQHFARLGDVHEQQVELLEAVGHRRQEPAFLPSRDRGLAGAPMWTVMVDVANERFKARLQLVERQCWRRQRFTADRVPGQIRQEHVIDGATAICSTFR